MGKDVALITGVSGQDGSYLAEYLLAKDYEVHGIVRRTSTSQRHRIDHLHSCPDFHLKYGDVTDSTNITSLIEAIRPTEIYNLAAQSHVKISFEIPEYTAQTDAIGTLRILEAVRTLGINCRIYQASTSELYGKVVETPQSETTPFYPRSPYAVSKLFAYWAVVNYREAYNMHASNGILFNHESPRRGENFVTRKITIEVSKIKVGLSSCLFLGNLDAKRDWGYAPDYVEAMWKMLQINTPDDFVIATGEAHSVREFVEKAFAFVDMNIVWEGEGVDEVGRDTTTNAIVVRVDPKYYRPTEVDSLLGNPKKAYECLGWKPTTSFDDLVTKMMLSDYMAVKKGLL